jgi:hypothetical protein
MAMRPNWFDTEFESKVEKASAEEALAAIAKNPRIVSAVRDALKQHDSQAGKPGWAGPTRPQAIRGAIAEVLTAQS